MKTRWRDTPTRDLQPGMTITNMGGRKWHVERVERDERELPVLTLFDMTENRRIVYDCNVRRPGMCVVEEPAE
jgi:hypothetical protein